MCYLKLFEGPDWRLETGRDQYEEFSDRVQSQQRERVSRPRRRGSSSSSSSSRAPAPALAMGRKFKWAGKKRGKDVISSSSSSSSSSVPDGTGLAVARRWEVAKALEGAKVHHEELARSREGMRNFRSRMKAQNENEGALRLSLQETFAARVSDEVERQNKGFKRKLDDAQAAEEVAELRARRRRLEDQLDVAKADSEASAHSATAQRKTPAEVGAAAAAAAAKAGATEQEAAELAGANAGILR